MRAIFKDLLFVLLDVCGIVGLVFGLAVAARWFWRIATATSLVVMLAVCVGCEVEFSDTNAPPAVGPDDACPDGRCPYRLVPPVDLPKEIRCDNYAGGSCMHASMIPLLRWQGQYELADYWRKNYRGAAGVETLVSISERLGIDYAYTTSGDEGFLDWCSRTRRGAAIYYGSNHAQTFLGYDADGNAVVLDNNNTDALKRIPREHFLRAWRSVGGGAITPVYSPSAPRPWI